MSVYQHKGSPYFHFDFQMRGLRFHGSTRSGNRRQAEAVEKSEREKAKQVLRARSQGAAALSINGAAGRYWTEVAQHQTCSKETWTNLERLVEYFGKENLLSEITDDDVTRLVAWRRGHRRWGRKSMKLITPSTVNRSTTEVLQKLFTRAKRKWNARFDHEPDWRDHMLKEPEERKRELNEQEADALEVTRRDDFADYFDFVHATGQRAYKECLVLWSEVNWSERQIVKKGKQDRTINIPITSGVAAILRRQIGNHPLWVFTYVAKRTDSRKGLVKGTRYPITKEGAKTQWRRMRTRASCSCPSVEDFRTHDLRHDLATKTLRKTGNLKLVKEVLNHADIKTTMRYAHVLDKEKRTALEDVQADQKSRKESRSASRKAS
jgi:site-specific recombinase XerD